MKFFIVISLVVLVKCRPQDIKKEQDGSVQIEKQEIRLLEANSTMPQNDATKLKQSTKEILDKIGELNQKQGLVTKRIKSAYTYIKIPTNQRNEHAKQHLLQAQFSNPIFDYLSRIPPDNKYEGYSSTAQINPDDVIPGQFIKRKVTHQQTVITPMLDGRYGNYFNQLVLQPDLFLNSFKEQIRKPAKRPFNFQNVPDSVKQSLENQTVQNIKNIVNTQFYPPPQLPYGYFDPYAQNPNYEFYYLPYNHPQSNNYNSNDPNDRIPPEVLQLLRSGGRQWQSPINQYFPITIRDPIQQIFNAFTSMVEYGEQSNQTTCCQNTLKTSQDLKEREGTLDLENEDKSLQNAKSRKIGNLQIIDNNEAEFKSDVEDSDPEEQFQRFEFGRTNLDSESKFLNAILNRSGPNHHHSLPDHFKNFSKDNTGNGIFIHKLKVRQGGVAIAGPGGVATAGHGGTAIVGPDGYAFTQPDSFAIAGSGAKVVAVNPGINLTSLLENPNFKRDKISARVGRIVAIGPVVYHNTGD